MMCWMRQNCGVNELQCSRAPRARFETLERRISLLIPKKINTVDFGSTCVCEQNVFCDEDAPNLWGLIWIWQKPFKEKCDLKANERMSYKYTDKVQLHKWDFLKKAYSVTFKKVI